MPADALQSAACFPTSEFLRFNFAEDLWGPAEASPHTFFLQPLIHGGERCPVAGAGVYLQGGAGDLTAGRLQQSQQAGGRGRRDGWLSQPRWQPGATAERKHLVPPSAAADSLIDFGFADVHKDSIGLRFCCCCPASSSFQTASRGGDFSERSCWIDGSKFQNWSVAFVFVLLLTWLKCAAS